MSAGFWLGAMRVAVVSLLMAGIAFAVLARWRGDSVVAWQGALLATEFGHGMALLVLVAGLVWFRLGPASAPALRWSGCVVGVGLAMLLLTPAWQAWRMGQGISVARLFLPWMGPDVNEVTVRREVYREADHRGRLWRW